MSRRYEEGCRMAIEKKFILIFFQVPFPFALFPKYNNYNNITTMSSTLLHKNIRSLWIASELVSMLQSARWYSTSTCAKRLVKVSSRCLLLKPRSLCYTSSHSPLISTSNRINSSSSLQSCSFSTEATQSTAEAREGRIRQTLEAQFQPVSLKIVDTSGGCGAFYSLSIVSPLFKGKTLVAQHRMVKEALKDEMSGLHGYTVQTKAAP